MLISHLGPMKTGKSLLLLVSAYQHEEKGANVIAFSYDKDTRFGAEARIVSRAGLSRPCLNFNEETSFKDLDLPQGCTIFIDECQFLTNQQVEQLHWMARSREIHCYGLKTDFRSRLFEGSARLVEVSDVIEDLKAVCACGKNAKFNLRLNKDGRAERQGPTVLIGDSEYVSVCGDCLYDYY